MKKMMKLLALIMAMMMVLSLGACSTGGTDGTTEPSGTEPTVDTTEPTGTEPTDDGKVEYTIYVEDLKGEPVSGVMVQVCKEGSTCFTPVKTGEDGRAVFRLESATDYYGTVSKDQTIKEYFEGEFQVTLIYDPQVA